MRPKKCRRTCCKISSDYFKPRGTPIDELMEVTLDPDEIEALRLAHIRLMYQEEAAERMNISRQTFGRIIDSAHKKITDALINGKALKLRRT